MENNLDDILVDSPEGQEKREKSKRKVLIGVASALLVAVVVAVIYFAVIRKGESNGFEATHSELEKFTKPETMPKSKEDEEFDKLIADIKARNLETNQPQISQSKTEELQDSHEDQKETTTKEDTLIQSKIEEMTKPSKEETQTQHAQKIIKEEQKKSEEIQKAKESVKQELKDEKKSGKQDKKSQEQKQIEKVKVKENMAKKEVKKQESKSSDKKTRKSVGQTFSSLETKIPQGFYLQVGVFANKPNVEFLSQISNYSYRVEKLDRNGRVVERYLIGPFDTKEEAKVKMEEIIEKVAKPIIVEIR